MYSAPAIEQTWSALFELLSQYLLGMERVREREREKGREIGGERRVGERGKKEQ